MNTLDTSLMRSRRAMSNRPSAMRAYILIFAVLGTLPFEAVLAQQPASSAEHDRARMRDAGQIETRAVQINAERALPATSERMLSVPRETFIVRGESRSLVETEKITSTPGRTIPGTSTPQSFSSTPLFDSGEDILTPDYTRQLDAIAARVKGKTDVRFRLIGHTDVQRLKKDLLPRFADNYALGLARAKQVGGYLQNKLGLDPSAFSFDSRGPDEPVATPADDINNWPVNRRVVVEAYYADTTAAQVIPPSVNRELTRLDPTVCAMLTAPQAAQAVAGGQPFRVSVDGRPVDPQRASHEADRERCIDVALEKHNLRLQYDNLRLQRSLNVTPWPQAVIKGEQVTFRGWSNYRYFIKSAELRILAGNTRGATDLIATVPLNEAFEARWTPGDGLPDTVYYKLRVMDGQGRFDETIVMPLAIVKQRQPLADTLPPADELLAGYGENRIDSANMPVEGGTLTVHGGNIRKGERVVALGLPTPVDARGNFVMEQIVPRAFNTAEISVIAADGQARIYRRNLELPRSDWFFVGIADLTVGRNRVTGPAALVTGDTQHYDNDAYTDGRIAFFTKGKINDKWTLTGALDTFNQPIRDIFKNFNYKDTRSLFNRIDPKDTWPVYGDDSTVLYDAPTQGKLYFKLEDGKSHVLWGNFKEALGDTQLAQINRGLYGANARYQSATTTGFGERRIKLEAFAADPGTLAAREDFRGTGGSLYFLKRQDITRGSERVRIEIRDRDSNLVMNTRALVPGADYTLDYLQGRVLLTNPLASLADDSQLIRTGGLAGNPAFLVVDYEFTPTNIAADTMAYGGRASAWVNDNVKLGITGSKQQQAGGNNRVDGIDVTLRKSDGTFAKLEQGRSQGPAIGSLNNSADGGFSFAQQAQAAGTDIRANASRVEAQVDLKDVGSAGQIGGYWQQRDRGYSAPGQVTDRDTRQFGVTGKLPLGAALGLKFKHDQKDETNGFDLTTSSVDVAYRINQHWSASIGMLRDKREQDSLVTVSQSFLPAPNVNTIGERTDVGARIDYRAGRDWGAYVFGQSTVRRTGSRLDNDRLGLGGTYRVNDKLSLLGEYSGGDGGAAGRVGLDYLYSDRTSTYLNYLVSTGRADDGLGARNGGMVAGIKSRFTDQLSMFTEQKYTIGNAGGLTHVYGIQLAPSEKWTFGLSAEDGYIGRESATEIERKAATFKVNYSSKDVKYGGAVEWRRDTSLDETRRSVLWRNNLSYRTSDDWRLIGRFDFSDSDSSKGPFFNGEFRDLMVGYAWRPARNDRLNVLFKLQYLADLAPSQQLTDSGVAVDFAQRSKVAAIDLTYELTPRWSIGGKYATRIGELRQTRDSSAPWFDSRATLSVLRADYKVVRNWDALLEVRRLSTSESGSRKGYLGALYYHINENLKFGGGYNFADFTDDVTNLSYRSRGPFVNAIGKW